MIGWASAHPDIAVWACAAVFLAAAGGIVVTAVRTLRRDSEPEVHHDGRVQPAAPAAAVALPVPVTDPVWMAAPTVDPYQGTPARFTGAAIRGTVTGGLWLRSEKASGVEGARGPADGQAAAVTGEGCQRAGELPGTNDPGGSPAAPDQGPAVAPAAIPPVAGPLPAGEPAAAAGRGGTDEELPPMSPMLAAALADAELAERQRQRGDDRPWEYLTGEWPALQWAAGPEVAL